MVKALRVVFGLAILAAMPAPAEEITITPSGARSSPPGPARAYTGTAVAETLGSPNDSSHVMAVRVTFEPGATTTDSLSHLAIWDFVEGSGGELMEHVSDEVYLAD